MMQKIEDGIYNVARLQTVVDEFVHSSSVSITIVLLSKSRNRSSHGSCYFILHGGGVSHIHLDRVINRLIATTSYT